MCTNGLLNHPWLVNVSVIRRTGYYSETWHPQAGEDQAFAATIRLTFAPLQILSVGASVVGHYLSATRNKTSARPWSETAEKFRTIFAGVHLKYFRLVWMGHKTMYHWRTLAVMDWKHRCTAPEGGVKVIAAEGADGATCFPRDRTPGVFWGAEQVKAMKVLIIMAARNRYGYARTTLQALYESWLPDDFHILIIDDRTTEYDVGDLVRERLPISPARYTIVSRPADSPNGPDAMDRLTAQLFLDHREYRLLICLPSDLVPEQQWYRRLRELLLATPKEAVHSLYHSGTHPTLKCQEGVCQMPRIGAAGAVFTRASARALFGDRVPPEGPDLDGSWSQAAARHGIPFCVPEESMAVHIGRHGSWGNSREEKAVKTRMQDYSPEVRGLIGLYLRGAPPKSNSKSGKVPRNLVQTWATHEPPAVLSAMAHQWRTLNLRWGYRLYNDVECVAFLRRVCGSRAAAASKTLKRGAFKADLFRYCYLYSRGGVYVDIDAKPLQPLDAFLSPHESFTSVRDRAGIDGVWNGFMAAVPGVPFLWQAMWSAIRQLEQQVYPAVPAPGGRDEAWGAVLSLTGPVLLGNCIRYALRLPPGVGFPSKARAGRHLVTLLKQTRSSSMTVQMGLENGVALFEVYYAGRLGDTTLKSSSYFDAVLQHNVYQNKSS